MSEILLSATVAQLVRDDPRRATVFDDHRVDYSFGGERLLSAVLTEPRVDSERLLADLEAMDAIPSDTDPAWGSASIDELIDHIVETHHGYLRRVLPELSSRLARVIRQHGRTHPEIETLGEVFTEFNAELQRHLDREERLLFPMARKIAKARRPVPEHAEAAHRIAVIHAEHEVAGRTLEALRQLSGDFSLPDDAGEEYRRLFESLRALERDLQAHVHKENHILLPALEALTAEQTS